MKKVYSVLLKNGNNVLANFENYLKPNDEVIIEIEDILHYGKIQKEIINAKSKVDSNILRIANNEDKNIYYDNLKDAKNAMLKCKEYVSELNLNMHVINAYFTFDRVQLIINFTSDERVDFRELVRKLASIYKTRIELRQIGARDRARISGGLGICGRNLCCGGFLKQIDSISMNKAKNQNLALNPSKINGVCGRLLCCLCYEDEEYTRCSKGLYAVGSKIKYAGHEAVITSVDILTRTYKVLIDDEKKLIKHEDIENASKK